jgi:hypothetical protein
MAAVNGDDPTSGEIRAGRLGNKCRSHDPRSPDLDFGPARKEALSGVNTLVDTGAALLGSAPYTAGVRNT